MKRNLIQFAALVAMLLPSFTYADTGFAMRCDGATTSTQAAACAGPRTWVHPTPGSSDAILSYPSVPTDSTTVAWNDTNLQFRPWISIPGNYGVLTCIKDLSATQVAITTVDNCASGSDPIAKKFVAASAVKTASGSITTPVVTVASLAWVAPTTNTDGSPLTDLALFNIYEGTSATNLAKVGSITLANTTYTTPSLAPGTYYFAVTAVNAAGTESAQSVIVSTVVLPPVSVVPPPPVSTPKIPGVPVQLKITISVEVGTTN